jgi:hypothetical protein
LSNYDNTDSWNYTVASWQIKNNNNANKISFVRGLNEDAVDALNPMFSLNGTTNVTRIVGIGLDSTTAIAADCSSGTSSVNSNNWGYHAAKYIGIPGWVSTILRRWKKVSLRDDNMVWRHRHPTL